MDWRRCGTGCWTSGNGFDFSTAFWMDIIISMVESRASWWSSTSRTLKSTVIFCKVRWYVVSNSGCFLFAWNQPNVIPSSIAFTVKLCLPGSYTGTKLYCIKNLPKVLLCSTMSWNQIQDCLTSLVPYTWVTPVLMPYQFRPSALQLHVSNSNADALSVQAQWTFASAVISTTPHNQNKTWAHNVGCCLC